MQANEELSGVELERSKLLWDKAAILAARQAELMVEQGLHKQVANRILEPFQYISVVLTATEFDNFFELRCHKDAQPEIQCLAMVMQSVLSLNTPKQLAVGEWHLPYVTEDERQVLDLDTQKKVSAARCCRVSYLKHDGATASVHEDIDLCDKLAGSRPIHASPFEHQATPDKVEEYGSLEDMIQWSNPNLHGNFSGWVQYRKLIENSFK
jgi:thymidylate synthase ThyX